MKSLLLLSLFIFSSPLMAATPVTTCEELKTLTRVEIETGRAAPQAIYDCIERGEDPPLKFRKSEGREPIDSSVGNTYLASPCRPSATQQCPNSMRKYRDGSESLLGYFAHDNPLLNKNPVPWGDIEHSTIPCGAVAAFAKNAANRLLGKVQIESPISLGEITNLISMVNQKIAKLQSTLNYMANVQARLHDQLNLRMGELDSQIDLVVDALVAAGSPVHSEINALSGELNTQVNSLIADSKTLSPSQIHARYTQIDQKTVALQQKIAEGREAAGAGTTSSVSQQDMDNRITLANNKIADVRSKLEEALGSAKAGEATAMNDLNAMRAEMTKVTGAFPAGINFLNTQINNGMSLLHGKVSEFINTHTSKTQDKINEELAFVNTEINRIKGWLNDAVSFVSGIQRKLDGVGGTIRDAINQDLTTLLGDFFKHKNCQNGKFWGVLNDIFAMALDGSSYIYDNSNNTFVSRSSPIIITMPVGTTINFNLSQGAPNPITMPFGGSLHTAEGQQVNFGDNTQLTFRTDGIVTSSTGNNFRVTPNQLLQLHPNEAVLIPPGTPVPVDPKGKVYPASPNTAIPPWMDDYVKQSAAK